MFSNDVVNFLMQCLGTVPYLVLAFSLFLVVPALLCGASIRLFVDGRCRGHLGLGAGLAVAAWASLCWLAVPHYYLGGYPCVPGLLLTEMAFRAPPVDTLPEELLVHVVNFVLWPAVGWLVFCVKGLVYRAQRSDTTIVGR